MKKIKIDEDQIYLGSLILVNRQYPVRNTVKRLSSIGTELLESSAAALLQRLLTALHIEKEIVPVSGFRSFQEQENIYYNSMEENGLQFTKTYVAEPGYSEHQTGFAIDLAEHKERIDFICPDFPYQGICQKFRMKAPFFGFIERYPKGKETITGIGHEPWHFRYVGFPHSLIMTEKKLTMEEYMIWLKQFEEKSLEYGVGSSRYRIRYLPWNGESREIALGENCSCLMSGNNMDGCVLTEWSL